MLAGRQAAVRRRRPNVSIERRLARVWSSGAVGSSSPPNGHIDAKCLLFNLSADLVPYAKRQRVQHAEGTAIDTGVAQGQRSLPSTTSPATSVVDGIVIDAANRPAGTPTVNSSSAPSVTRSAGSRSC